MQPETRARTFACWAVALLAMAALPLLPGASAQTQAAGQAVGHFVVDAQGLARAQHLDLTIIEEQGRLLDYDITTHGLIFDAVAIADFQPTGKLEGVGTSMLRLPGEGVDVRVFDDAHGALLITADQAQRIDFDLADGVRPARDAESPAIMHLWADGRTVGSLALLHGGRDGALAMQDGHLAADIPAEGGLLFVARPPAADEADQRLLAAWAASDTLIGSARRTGDGYETSRYQSAASFGATAQGAWRVTGGMAGPGAAAFDFPASQTATLFVDGNAATQVADASELLALLDQGIAAYHTSIKQGRTFMLAAWPSGEHALALRTGAHAQTDAQARAEQEERADTQVEGEFVELPDGRFEGDHLAATAHEGEAQVSAIAVADTTTGTHEIVFDSITFQRPVTPSVTGPELSLDTPELELSLWDETHATILAQANVPGDLVFELGEAIVPRYQTTRVVALDRMAADGQADLVGHLVLTTPLGSHAAWDGAATGTLVANLGQQAGVVFLAADKSDGDARQALLDVLSTGRVAGHVIMGMDVGARHAVSVPHVKSAHIEATPTVPGYRIDAIADAGATILALETRGFGLVATHASQIEVMVDGKLATRVPRLALATPAFEPRFDVIDRADGSFLVLVDAAAAIQNGAQIDLISNKQVDAQARGATDAFGRYQLDESGRAIGDHTRLRIHPDAGAITNFGLLGTGETVFASLTAGAGAFTSTGIDGGDVIEVANPQARLAFADTSQAFTRIDALTDTTAAFHLAAGLEARSRSDGIVEIMRQGGATLGSLVIVGAHDGAEQASRLDMTARDQVDARLAAGAALMFRAHHGVDGELTRAQQTMLDKAIATGDIAAHVIVQTRTDANAAGAVTTAAVADLDRRVETVVAATQGRVDVTVSSAVATGRTFVLSLDSATLPALQTGDAEILFDGQAATQASSYADILDPNDDAGAAEYFVLAGEAGTQVLVSVPHFSVHTVTLQEQTDAVNAGILLYSTGILGALAVIQTGVIMRRRTL